MKFKLSQILESNILLEGRREDVIKKYGENHTDLVDMFVDIDPSGNNKYLDWMVKTALGKNQDQRTPMAGDVGKVVNDFHRLLSKIKQKDINSYKSLDELSLVVKQAIADEEEKQISKQAKKLYDKDGVLIYAPFTVQASCRYGAGSKWCIAGKSDSRGLNTYFDDYSKHSNFYFFINNNLNPSSSPRDYKYALQWRFDRGSDDLTWWDAQDNSHSNPPSWVTPEMIQVAKNFNPQHKKIKLEAKSKAFIENPSWNEYNTYSDILTPEQKTSVINKIINKGGLNSQAFSVLAKDLTDKQKMDFITNYVKGNVNVSDYRNMKDNLNQGQKITLITFNPTILNNYDVMNELNSELTDEQKYKIAKNIDAKQINNTDSKVLFRKWSMTEEERAKHSSTSFYVFLSTPSEYIEKLVKVDPLDPDSYRTINMMKLRKQVQADTRMFGIKTKAGLLDEFIGKSSDGVDEATIDMIKQNSTSI